MRGMGLRQHGRQHAGAHRSRLNGRKISTHRHAWVATMDCVMTAPLLLPRALTSEVDTSWREENASKKESRTSVVIQSAAAMLWRHAFPLSRSFEPYSRLRRNRRPSASTKNNSDGDARKPTRVCAARLGGGSQRLEDGLRSRLQPGPAAAQRRRAAVARSVLSSIQVELKPA